MAKVFLTIKSYANVAFNEEKVELLKLHNIPYEIHDEKIYLISKTAVSARSREYDEVYSKFCMQIADSSDAPIYLGEGALEEDKLPVLINVFGNHLEFDIELMCNGDSSSGQLNLVKNEGTGEINWESEIEEPDEEDEICENCGYENYMCDCEKDEEEETTELKEDLEENPVSLINLTSFAVLFDGFFGYKKAKSLDELHQLIKHNIYDGRWDLLKENWSESISLYEKLTAGIKTYEEAFDKMVVILKDSNLDENQTTAFLDLTLKMYLDIYSSKGVLDNELNEDNSFNTNHPNYGKFNVFSYLEKSFKNQVVAEFLNSKRLYSAEELSDEIKIEQLEKEKLEMKNLFKEFEGWDIDNSSARLVIVSEKKNIKKLDEEELLDYYGLTDGDDGEIQSYIYSDSFEGFVSSQEFGSDVFKNEITSAKNFFDQLLKFNVDHLWFIEDDGLKFISEIGDEDILLVEKYYSMFEYAIVCEVCHLTGDDY